MKNNSSQQTNLTSTGQYLKSFFEEKRLPYDFWEIEDENGVIHFIDSEFVIEALIHDRTEQQRKAADIIREIDFYNGDVMHFLKYCAEGIAAGYAQRRKAAA